MPFINNKVRNLSRITEIVNILIKYGFNGFVLSTPLKRFLKPAEISQAEKSSASTNFSAGMLLLGKALEEAGPTIIGFARFLSYRPDILPDKFLKVFADLPPGVLPFNRETAEKVFCNSFGKSFNDVFSYFDNLPFASSSFGYIYRARLISGQDVAVKIRMPNCEKIVRTDLTLIRDFISLLDGFLAAHGIRDALSLVDEFESEILRALDFTNEAFMSKCFFKAAVNIPQLVTGEIFTDLSTPDVFVCSYFNAARFFYPDELKLAGLNLKTCAENYLQIFLSFIISSGFFYSDSKNISAVVLADYRLAFTDFSSMEILESDLKNVFAQMLDCLCSKDVDKLCKLIYAVSDCTDIDNYLLFKKDIGRHIEILKCLDIKDDFVHEFSLGLQRSVFIHKIKLPREIVAAFSSLAAAENIAHKVFPEVSVLKCFKQISGSSQWLPFLNFSFRDNKISLDNSFLSDEVRSVVTKIRKGDINFNVGINDLSKLIRKSDIAVNKMVYTLLTCVIIVTSTMLALFDKVSPSFFGYPITAVAGYVLSFILAMSLLFYTIRNRFKNNRE